MEKITEIQDLDPDKKLYYLEKYYETASEFFDCKDQVVTDEEIESIIEKFKVKPAAEYRKVINLKNWKFKLDIDNKGINEGFFINDYNDSDWQDETLPHSFSDIPDDPEVFGRTDHLIYTKYTQRCDIYRGKMNGLYRTGLTVEKIKDDEVAYINVSNANLESDLWVNETPVMMKHTGLFPYKVDITEVLKRLTGPDPVIAARVTNIASNVPHMFYNGFQFSYFGSRYTGGNEYYDWKDQAWGGLAGDVTVSIMNKNHINNVFIHTKSISSDNKEANICLDIELRNQTNKKFSGIVAIEIIKWSPERSEEVIKINESVNILPLNDNKYEINVAINEPDLWSPMSPDLYLAHVLLKDTEGHPIDDAYETFGIRTFEMHGPHFYLNGTKTILQGTHDVCNYFGESAICPGDHIIVKDLLLHKKLGSNCSRWPSDIRMHYKKIAEYCDQFGFMLSWAGFFEVWQPHPEMEMMMVRDAVEMLRDLRNHPSIVIWEMADEALAFDTEPYRKMRFTEKMHETVYNTDNTRPIIPSGSYIEDFLIKMQSQEYQNLSVDERRSEVIKNYPGFDRDQLVWDFHHCPLPPYKPNYEVVANVAKSLGGKRATVFTEFGLDALPDPRYISEAYDGFRWNANPFIVDDRTIIDKACYGKKITQEDWKLTQAMQAQFVSSIVSNIRQYPDIISAYYFVCMMDVWTFYYGATDAFGNCKLSYFVMQSHFHPVFISALHGNTVVSSTDEITVKISNYDKKIINANLQISINRINDEPDSIENTAKTNAEMKFTGINAEGNVSLTKIASFNLEDMSDGLYSIKYHLYKNDGELIAKMMEITYLQEQSAAPYTL